MSAFHLFENTTRKKKPNISRRKLDGTTGGPLKKLSRLSIGLTELLMRFRAILNNASSSYRSQLVHHVKIMQSIWPPPPYESRLKRVEDTWTKTTVPTSAYRFWSELWGEEIQKVTHSDSFDTEQKYSSAASTRVLTTASALAQQNRRKKSFIGKIKLSTENTEWPLLLHVDSQLVGRPDPLPRHVVQDGVEARIAERVHLFREIRVVRH